jgi:hypothetical protein
MAVAAVVVVTSQRKKASRSLIAISDVESVFNDQVIKELSQILKLSAAADVHRFAESIRIAARTFLEQKAELGAPQLRATVKRLYRLNRRAEDGSDDAAQALARAVDAMSIDVRRWLLCYYGPHECYIPTAAEILSPVTRQRAVERIRVSLSFGGREVTGRKRPGGRRSRSFEPLLRVPQKIPRGRPPGSAEREFVQWLAIAHLEATGQPPPYTAHYNVDIRGRSANFVQRCFELVGAPTGNVTRLINQYGAERKRAERRARTAEAD